MNERKLPNGPSESGMSLKILVREESFEYQKAWIFLNQLFIMLHDRFTRDGLNKVVHGIWHAIQDVFALSSGRGGTMFYSSGLSDLLDRVFVASQLVGEQVAGVSDKLAARIVNDCAYVIHRNHMKESYCLYDLFDVLSQLDGRTYSRSNVKWEVVLRDRFIFNENDKENDTTLCDLGDVTYQHRLTHPILRGSNGAPRETRSTVWCVYTSNENDELVGEGEVSMSVLDFAEYLATIIPSRGRVDLRLVHVEDEETVDRFGLGVQGAEDFPLYQFWKLTLTEKALSDLRYFFDGAFGQDESLQNGSALLCEFNADGKLCLYASDVEVLALVEFRVDYHTDLIS